MLRKELIICVCAAFILLGSFSTALAENNELADEIMSDTSETKADVAARNFVYEERLALYGSEGSYEAEHEAVATPKALHAAANYDYNQAEDWQLRVDDQGSSDTGVFDENRVICVNC